MSKDQKPVPLPPDKKGLALSLVQGAVMCFANADALYAEASILGNARAWARGVTLHQISLEECAKVEMIAGAVTSILMGETVDLKQLHRAMVRHDAKNKANAYFLPKSEDEQEARAAGDIEQAVSAFRQVQRRFHEASNDDKNATLYVNPGDPFESPLERFTEDDFVRVRARNEEFMSLTYPKVEMLKRWAENFDNAAESIHDTSAALGLERLDRSRPESIADLENSLMERLESQARSRMGPP